MVEFPPLLCIPSVDCLSLTQSQSQTVCFYISVRFLVSFSPSLSIKFANLYPQLMLGTCKMLLNPEQVDLAGWRGQYFPGIIRCHNLMAVMGVITFIRGTEDGKSFYTLCAACYVNAKYLLPIDGRAVLKLARFYVNIGYTVCTRTTSFFPFSCWWCCAWEMEMTRVGRERGYSSG